MKLLPTNNTIIEKLVYLVRCEPFAVAYIIVVFLVLAAIFWL